MCRICPPPPEDPPEEDPLFVLCEYNVTNEWNAGFTVQVSLTNNNQSSINNWQVGIQYPDATSIAGAWNATVSNSQPFMFSNAQYNGQINVGSTVSFGFNANKAVHNTPAESPVLSGMCGEVETPKSIGRINATD